MDEYGIGGETWVERLENMIALSLDKQETLVGTVQAQKRTISEQEAKLGEFRRDWAYLYTRERFLTTAFLQ